MNTPGLGIHTLDDLPAVANCTLSSMAEFASHTYVNFSSLEKISSFDAVKADINTQKAGVPSRFTWTHNDVFFMPLQTDIDKTHANRVSINILDGEHDELVLRLEEFLYKVFNL